MKDLTLFQILFVTYCDVVDNAQCTSAETSNPKGNMLLFIWMMVMQRESSNVNEIGKVQIEQ